MKKYFLFISSFCLINYSSAQVGQSGMVFLKLGTGPKTAAMGDVLSVINIDPSVQQLNPAAIGFGNHFQIMLSHREWIEDSRTEFLGTIIPFNNFRFGLSINSTNIADIPIRNVPGPTIGTFTAHYAAMSFTSSYKYNNLIFGVTSKFLYEKIYIEEAMGYAFDVGTIYKTPIYVVASISFNNLGSMTPLKNTSTKLPTLMRLGVLKSFYLENLATTITPSTEFLHIFPEKNNHLHLGAEFLYKNIFAIRAGYQTGYESRNITAGIGLKYRIFSIDYAYIPFKFSFNSSHIISLTITTPEIKEVQ